MINIVCALHCEAKPIVDFYKLSALPNCIFPIYSNEQINVVVSGIGKVDTAAAMTYLFVKTLEQKNNAWLNYGISGHKSAELGAWFNVNKITEDSTGLNWYPSRFQNLDCLTASLETVDNPISQYESEKLYDMEASAFMATALKFSSIELVQLMKIVSDNEENHLDQINKKHVQLLLLDNISPLISIVNVLKEQKNEFDNIYDVDELYGEILKKWHFTQYQQKEVQRLIQRWKLLCNKEHIDQLEKCQDAKWVITWFKGQLADAKVAF